MHTPLFKTLFCIFLLSPFLFAEEVEEVKEAVPASLDEAHTFEQIQSFVDYSFAESRKNLKTMDDQNRFLETYPPIGIAGGKKIIALGGDDESLEYGYGILGAALNWSLKKHPENAAELESLAETLKADGKFPKLVHHIRFELFYHKWRLFDAGSFGQDKFDTLKKEAKELAITKGRNHSRLGPIECVLETADKESRRRGDSKLLDETLEDLVQFFKTAQPDDAAKTEQYLRGFCRRMVGSPFELWGKTVDGTDFQWSDYAGRIVLIDFTASWCGPCRAEMPNVVEMYEKYHDRGLEVVCVGYEDKTDALKKMIKEDNISFTMISEELSGGDGVDPRGLPSSYYGVHGIPEIFLIGQDGRIIATNLRGAELRDRIEKQLAEK